MLGMYRTVGRMIPESITLADLMAKDLSGVYAYELIEEGRCHPACLVSDPAILEEGCECACDGRWRGALWLAKIDD